MFLLNKVFQLRDKASKADEKPFLEHLEDLRYTITRVVITLLITTIVSFSYRDTLMEILRKPIDKVWTTHSDKKLPSDPLFDVESWERAKTHSDALAHLPEKQQAYFQQNLSPQQSRLMQIFIAYKSAIALPEESRAAYLQNYPDILAEDKTFFPELLSKKPDTQLGSRDKFRFMSTLNPTESFMLSMKLAIYAGIVIAFPLLLYFILQFVIPGLHQNEKKALYPALAVGFGLFLSGVFFAYWWILPSVLEFFYTYGESMGVANDWRIGYYLSFATQFTMIFGLCFELPVIVWVLVKVGLLSYELMSRTRSYAILAIVIISAIVTPTPDAFTLMLLAVPMIVLYELSIWMAWFDARKAKKREEAEEAERLNRLIAMHNSDEDRTAHADEFPEDHSTSIHDDYHSTEEIDHPYEDYPTPPDPTSTDEDYPTVPEPTPPDEDQPTSPEPTHLKE